MTVSPDVVVIGGGVIGLSTALELAKAGRNVRVIVRDALESASRAGAGMLAPVSEGLHVGASTDMLQLCSLSRNLYPKFVHDVQSLSGSDVQYVSQQDFLMPLLEGERIPVIPGGSFLDATSLRNVEPALGPAVRGALRIPRDAHVNNRLLGNALLDACRKLNVEICEGVEVQKLQVSADGSSVEGLILESGDTMVAPHYVAACGAWSNKLLKGIPVRPVKGQMLCLKPAPGNNHPSHLQHVLYGQDVYVVSKENCSMYYVGATVEEAGFSRSTTAGGVLKLLNAATKLVPGFADYQIAETWAGLRPGTPDQSPIIGNTDFANLTVATGTYRNGILLAPIVGKMTAACAMGEEESLPGEMQSLLEKFSINRFLDIVPPEKNQKEPKQYSTPVPVNSPLNGANIEERVPKKLEQNGSASSRDDNGIMMWQIMPNGSKRAIQPGAKFVQKMQTASSASVSNGVVNNEANSAESESHAAVTLTPSAPDWTEVNESNDAYDAVMQFRDNAEETLLKGTADSRAFGRTKSSLEVDGQVLSLSAEEEAVFDEAFAEAKKEISTWGDGSLRKDSLPRIPDNGAFLQAEFPE